MTARDLAPGPYRVAESAGGVVIDANDRPVAFIAARLNTWDEAWREIAAEMAAAHEMREALEAMCRLLSNRILGTGGNPTADNVLWVECVKACDAARNALAKAGPDLSQLDPKPVVTTTVYLIWSFEHKKWRALKGGGYSDDIVNAGHYSREQAEAICLWANIAAVNEAMVPLPDSAVIRIARGRST